MKERPIIRVLIVTGHPQVGQGLCTVLKLADPTTRVEVVGSLHDAVEQARRESPDVALVDLEMPQGEGYDTIRQIRSLFPETPSIALTAHDYPSARARAMEAGANQVIVKGLGYQEFIAVIQAWV